MLERNFDLKERERVRENADVKEDCKVPNDRKLYVQENKYSGARQS